MVQVWHALAFFALASTARVLALATSYTTSVKVNNTDQMASPHPFLFSLGLKYARSKQGTPGPHADASVNSKVYVRNLSWNTTDDTLRNVFSEFGQVLDSIVMRDRNTGRSRGFGFVTFGSAAEADIAINGLNEKDLDGRRIKVNIANAR
ncbi:hypothetical protein C8F04DRAFT_1188095 [Mycena alexandri]|uniref:RRM domain-containing protein n=1 Tax=Mycena alexandri TaxID=1745969 RepID=A0AAD6SK04_9AGAR|nr:hypothetical protein C8F04DRAFT_1188095 [Mycena alexandri]